MSDTPSPKRSKRPEPIPITYMPWVDSNGHKRIMTVRGAQRHKIDTDLLTQAVLMIGEDRWRSRRRGRLVLKHLDHDHPSDSPAVDRPEDPDLPTP